MGLAVLTDDTGYDVSFDENIFSVNNEKTERQESSKEIIHSGKTVAKTQQSNEKGKVLVFNQSSVETFPQNPSDLKKEVNGAVDEISDLTITCELEIKNNVYTKIQLPPSFFQQDVFVGMPITLSLDNSSGYPKPLIKKRELTDEFKNMYQDEIELLISELP